MTDKKIHIADEDAAIRNMLSTMFQMDGYEALVYETGEDLLEGCRTYSNYPVLLDTHMPDRPGLDILNDLKSKKYQAPIFIISDKGDIPMAVSAIKSGAYDFIEKPFDGPHILERVDQAVETYARRQHVNNGSDFEGAEQLTPREKDVLKLIAEGKSNRETGNELEISPRTVEVHRARIMSKLGAKNAADLIRIVFDR